MQSRPLLYFLFFLYIIVVATFFYRQDTPSLIVFYLLFLLFYLISKNMIVVLGSSLALMMVLILFRQGVKEGMTQPEVKSDEPSPGSMKIPEDKKLDDFETTFNLLQKNMDDINRIREETQNKLNTLKEISKEPSKEPSKGPTKPTPPL
jgi:hypothetical protein